VSGARKAPLTFFVPAALTDQVVASSFPRTHSHDGKMNESKIDEVLDKLIRDVEASVHAFYRGDVRQHTQRVKTDTFLREARQALMSLGPDSAGAAPAAETSGAPAASGANGTLSADEVAAATRCVMAWMPMGAPTSASPASRCVPAAKEMAPTWGEREKARLALRRLAV